MELEPTTLSAPLEMHDLHRVQSLRAAMIPVFQAKFDEWWRGQYGDVGPVPRITVEWGDPKEGEGVR